MYNWDMLYPLVANQEEVYDPLTINKDSQP